MCKRKFFYSFGSSTSCQVPKAEGAGVHRSIRTLEKGIQPFIYFLLVISFLLLFLCHDQNVFLLFVVIYGL